MSRCANSAGGVEPCACGAGCGATRTVKAHADGPRSGTAERAAAWPGGGPRGCRAGALRRARGVKEETGGRMSARLCHGLCRGALALSSRVRSALREVVREGEEMAHSLVLALLNSRETPVLLKGGGARHARGLWPNGPMPPHGVARCVGHSGCAGRYSTVHYLAESRALPPLAACSLCPPPPRRAPPPGRRGGKCGERDARRDGTPAGAPRKPSWPGSSSLIRRKVRTIVFCCPAATLLPFCSNS